ncbi:hypothetical protein NHX12_000740 [Muraenolepis orangiensis]|uniref:RING-type domain-containing protein n=1 Tax=Muraenolepis orangiensis TaxID=630683 RepID=A0A9Q0E0R7_9TELE|nr:hypothetical protein NHX12_000740 [Muraenolepis orangiensis]
MSDREQPSQPPGADPPSPSQPQNVKPRPEGQKSARRSLRVRRSQSSSSERGGARRRARERHEEERGGRRRRRSEEAQEAAAAAAATAQQQRRRRTKSPTHDRRKSPPRDHGDVEDTECIVCFCSYDNVFKTPKLLACGHTFCLECLARINVTSPELTSLSCPVCREPTRIPHGRDLPHLHNNQAVFSLLPPNMQRALSVRFKRNKGKLILKHTGTLADRKLATITLPKRKQQERAVATGPGIPLSPMELEAATPPSATMLDVGQPPSRVRGRLRRLFRSDRCYYVVVAAIITITVALMLVGVLAFIIMPNIAGANSQATNQTTQAPPFPGS